MKCDTLLLGGLTDKHSTLNIAVDFLNSVEPIAFSTETVYGLGVRIDDIRGVGAIYAIRTGIRTIP